MNKQQALNLIRDTFERPFEKEQFTKFIKNLLKHIEETTFTYQGQYIPDAYKEYISSLERIGKFTDGENKIDILIVKLKKETSLRRARTMQRNFIAWYLKGSRGGIYKNAALVAFVSPNENDWRFSLVKVDYAFDENGKVIEEKSPARRWSFLVGKNEKSHTAQSRLVSILEDDEHNPTLAQLEEAFNIEPVTKEFFDKYRALLIRTVDALDKIVKEDQTVRKDFEKKDIKTVDFAKKLLGQIVFLYFLQKKGWFGVPQDKKWGEGDKNFIRNLFKKCKNEGKNFFNDYLEPLFYNTLNNPRTDQLDPTWSKVFNCKIPFLNGGLFEPIGGYDWDHIDILLPNDLFSNKNGNHEGDGILDIFDLFNFTVKEDEPLEKEVAIDPELLGKLYEKFNAIRHDNFYEYKEALLSGKRSLEKKFNKKFGVYYTPREIVHYMCQQSLIYYLSTELEGKVSKEDIEKLVKYGEQFTENEATALIKEQQIKEGKQKTSDYELKLPESIRKNAKAIDDKLRDIKICDPAVGSGAFLVGMMHEIVKTRNVLSVFICSTGISTSENGNTNIPACGDKQSRKSPYGTINNTSQTGMSVLPTSYDFKLECIENSLYGVDIDAGACEVAKLRLWLSLVVDEEDIKNVRPLPNLDYKIVCGNSLLGYPYKPSGLTEIEKLKDKFINETHPKEKERLKKQIDKVIYGLFKNTEKSLGYKVTVDFKINFSEVFHQKGGFDVVIANPPYVRQESIKEIKPQLKKQFRGFFCGTADIYTYFYKQGIEILRDGGHLCFIAPNKFMRARYGKNTRKLLAKDVKPKLIIDFGDLPIFEATTYPAIVLLEKEKPEKDETFLAATFTEKEQIEYMEKTLARIAFPRRISTLDIQSWNLERPQILALMEKLRKRGVPLKEYVQGRFYRGILTGLNKAFVIDQVTRDRLIKEDHRSEELIKPWLRGKDIKRWKAQWAGLYVINIPSSANREWPWSHARTEAEARELFRQTFPAIHYHLSQWEEKLKKRDDKGKFWWELRSCAYYKEFERPKIIYPDIAKRPEFTWDETKAFLGNTAYILPTGEKWLLGLLNSQLMWWFYLNITSSIRGRFVRFIAQYIGQLPILLLKESSRSTIISLVEKILTNPDSPEVPHLEREIDALVYDLYGLTEEEIGIVEGKTYDNK